MSLVRSHTAHQLRARRSSYITYGSSPAEMPTTAELALVGQQVGRHRSLEAGEGAKMCFRSPAAMVGVLASTSRGQTAAPDEQLTAFPIRYVSKSHLFQLPEIEKAHGKGREPRARIAENQVVFSKSQFKKNQEN